VKGTLLGKSSIFPFDRGLNILQNRSGHESRKIPAPEGDGNPIFQIVASYFTD
jgi:hypothetical protein